MENDIKRFIVCPQVVVYPGILKNTQDILKMVKRSEIVKEKIHNIPPSGPWLESGLSTQFDGPRGGTYEYEDEDSILQKSVINNIQDVYDIVVKDFFNYYGPDNLWPDFIKNWDTSNYDFWRSSGISFLKYDQKDYSYDPVNGKHHIAMHFHTDTNSKNLNSAGNKLVVTVTMYLNDDYDGGEICYIDNATGKSYMYKPKAGDVTVFPSGEPFLHGVFPQYGSERYLLRMFLMYNFPGTSEWLEEKSKHETEIWDKMEKERLNFLRQNGDIQRQVIFPGQKPDADFEGQIIYMKEDPIKVIIGYKN